MRLVVTFENELMRFYQCIITVALVGWFFTTGVHALWQQTLPDSIVASNVFTPNGDGENDFFEVRAESGKAVLLNVYTRAGVLIFSIEARLCYWDGYSLSGVEMPTGIYYYTAEVRGSSPKVSKNGFVHLYR